MTRRPLVCGNWKLHLGPADAEAFAGALAARFADTPSVDLAVFPTSLSVDRVARVLRRSTVRVGVQRVAPAATGAFTGRTSAAMARSLGAAWALAGHSECRAQLGDDDARVRAQVDAILAAGLLPLICVGETLAERDAGAVEDVLARQVHAALEGLEVDQVATCTLAYEPVWAIGTGRTASPDQAQQAHAFLRGLLADRTSPVLADGMRLLYGGSVKPGNAASLLGQPDVDGALVGGASLDVDAFAGIVDAASRTP